MHIGTNIQKLRRVRDITQEQLAEHLNISVSAISQWENGKTSPDLSQLPSLAYLFEVSADVILGIDIDSKAIQIDAIYDAADKKAIAGHYDQAVAILREGLTKFPASHKLMGALAIKLFVSPWYDKNESEKEAQRYEISALCQKILSECTDNDIKTDAFTIACRCNPKDDKLMAGALAFAKSLPVYNSAQNEMLTLIYTGDNLIAQLRENIMAAVCRLSSNLQCITEEAYDNGTPAYNDDDVLTICKKGICLYETIYEDGDYGIDAQMLVIFHKRLMRIYAARSGSENALAAFNAFEQAAKYSMYFDSYDHTGTHTSLLFKGRELGGYYKNYPDESYMRKLMQIVSDPLYDNIRAHPRFAEVSAEYN